VVKKCGHHDAVATLGLDESVRVVIPPLIVYPIPLSPSAIMHQWLPVTGQHSLMQYVRLVVIRSVPSRFPRLCSKKLKTFQGPMPKTTKQVSANRSSPSHPLHGSQYPSRLLAFPECMPCEVGWCWDDFICHIPLGEHNICRVA
jgi:hypothetical protein